MWRRILALMIKEFLALLKDKRGRMVLIIPPIVQLIVFGYAATYDLNDVKYAVYNEDPGLASRQVLAHFDHSPTFRLVKTLHSDKQIKPLIDGKKALLVLRIGPDFTRNLRLHRPAQIQAIIDGRDSNTALILLGYIRTIINRFNRIALILQN